MIGAFLGYGCYHGMVSENCSYYRTHMGGFPMEIFPGKWLSLSTLLALTAHPFTQISNLV